MSSDDIHVGLENNLENKPIIFSVGHRCTSASLIKELHMKYESYPFDWVVSKLEVINHCLNDNFKTYLDVSNYELMRSQTFNKCDNIKYHIGYEDIVFNKKYETMFFESEYNVDCNEPQNEYGTYGMALAETHHDIRTDNHKGYFNRCVDRFKRMIAIPRQKFYLYVHPLTGERHFEERKADLILYFLKFVEGFTTHVNNAFGIFFIVVRNGNKKHQIETLFETDNMTIRVLYANDYLVDAGGVYDGDFYNEQYVMLTTIESILKEHGETRR